MWSIHAAHARFSILPKVLSGTSMKMEFRECAASYFLGIGMLSNMEGNANPAFPEVQQEKWVQKGNKKNE